MRENTDALIALHDVRKVYQMDSIEVVALQGVSLSIGAGEYVAIIGPSGSGKSTLMHILGCLDRPTDGRYLLDGQDVGRIHDGQMAVVRNRKIGFVFQSFNLLPRMSALQNVILPLMYSNGQTPGDPEARAWAVLEAVGLGERLHHRPNQLSGGQQQRVAIARALVNNPAVILADEPTGNLDSRSGQEIMALLEQMNADGVTLILVTHDPEIAAHARRVVRLHDGQIVFDEVRS